MDEYIKKSEAVKAIIEHPSKMAVFTEKAIRAIENLPAADVVPVVRCKDCLYKVRTSDGEYNPEDIVCSYFMTDGMDSNDFCSYGEKEYTGEQI